MDYNATEMLERMGNQVARVSQQSLRESAFDRIADRNDALWRFLTDKTLSEAERREAFDRAFADRKGE
jgi:hypothetical protein